jgi:hypothetical protein
MTFSPLRPLALVSVLALAACSSEDPVEVYMGPGCAVPEAEHPAFTTPARDAALCGNGYTSASIATACDAHFHVCRETEWHARYPEGASPAGTLTTWGAAQADRCAGGVWQADQPVSARTWDGNVCGDPYNPWNNGKFIVADDGTTILEGDGSWGDWDASFSATALTDGLAVYCCKS